MGWKKDNIRKVKDHVFYKTHILDFYPELGEEPEIKRFDADLKQALAWKRLEAGVYNQNDITWLKHEALERRYEVQFDLPYSKSHKAAQERFDGNPWKNDL